jgi:hypothetical protein
MSDYEAVALFCLLLGSGGLLLAVRSVLVKRLPWAFGDTPRRLTGYSRIFFWLQIALLWLYSVVLVAVATLLYKSILTSG